MSETKKKFYNKKSKKIGAGSNRTYKRNKYGTSGIITTLSEAADRVVLTGEKTHFSAPNARNCIQTIACMPNITKQKLNGARTEYSNAALFPDFTKQAKLYSHYRVMYFSASVVFENQGSSVHSTVEMDATEISDVDAMMLTTHGKKHDLDANDKKVFRAWKAATAQDLDWKPISSIATDAPRAYIKMLQDGLPLAEPGLNPKMNADGSENEGDHARKEQKCSVNLKCVVEFKGRLKDISELDNNLVPPLNP